MKDTEYGMHRHMPGVTYEEAIERVTAALKEQGFGILTRIDVAETLKAKIGADFRPYVILGACNPVLAHQALSADDNIGLMLPCNVCVYEQDGQVTIAVIKPKAAMEAVGNDRLSDVAASIEAKLEKIFAAVS